jgi:cytochrome c oxidase assembly protein subunit 15
MGSAAPTHDRVPWYRRPVPPDAYRAIAAASVWAFALTIVSGAAVRLTGSGLGCSDWPNCTNRGVVAPMRFHAWVEFGNRLITVAVTVVTITAFAAALRRAPRRRDLTLLAGGLVVGILAEIVLGAFVVYSHLNPVLVTIHFLLGLIVLADATILHVRSGWPDPPPGGSIEALPVVHKPQILLSRLALVALTVTACLGTVVTSTGPHGGDPKAPRYHFSLHTVAQRHGTSAEVFLVIVLFLLWRLSRTGAPEQVMRRAQILLGALVAQAAVGYTQYLNGDPVGLVALHVVGASVLVIAAIRFHMGLWEHRAASSIASSGAAGPITAGLIAPRT